MQRGEDQLRQRGEDQLMQRGEDQLRQRGEDQLMQLMQRGGAWREPARFSRRRIPYLQAAASRIRLLILACKGRQPHHIRSGQASLLLSGPARPAGPANGVA
jgi:hypothetical protein